MNQSDFAHLYHSYKEFKQYIKNRFDTIKQIKCLSADIDKLYQAQIYRVQQLDDECYIYEIADGDFSGSLLIKYIENSPDGGYENSFYISNELLYGDLVNDILSMQAEVQRQIKEQEEINKKNQAKQNRENLKTREIKELKRLANKYPKLAKEVIDNE